MTSYRLTENGVRLRAQPGTSAAILIHNLGHGTLVTSLSDQMVSGDGHTWHHIRTSAGQEGWVAAEFLGPLLSGGAPGRHPGGPTTFPPDPTDRPPDKKR